MGYPLAAIVTMLLCSRGTALDYVPHLGPSVVSFHRPVRLRQQGHPHEKRIRGLGGLLTFREMELRDSRCGRLAFPGRKPATGRLLSWGSFIGRSANWLDGSS
jgi:hypothetical protein